MHEKLTLLEEKRQEYARVPYNSPEDFEELSTHLCDTSANVLLETNVETLNRNFSSVYDDGNLHVWKRNIDSRRMTVRGEFYVECSAEEFINFAHDPILRSRWDMSYEKCEVLSSKPLFEIRYMKFSGMGGVAARDVVMFCVKRRMRRSIYISVCCSLNDSLKPLQSDCVRGTLCLSCFVAVPNGHEDECKVHFISDGDLNGWIPIFVSNNVTSFLLPRVVKKLMAKASEWYRDTDSESIDIQVEEC